MKNRALFFTAILATTVFPVFSRAGLVGIGIKGGIGLSSYWGKDAADTAGMTTTMRSGLCAGAMVDLNFNEFVACQLEFLYSMKGKSAIGDYATYSKGITIKTDYFELPLLLRFSYPVGEISRFFLCAGPTSSFLISSKKDSTVVAQPSQITITDVTVDTKQQASSFDIGATIGGGIAVRAGPGDVIFEVRYTLGLVDRYIKTGADARQPDIKNSYIAFLAGYSITF